MARREVVNQEPEVIETACYVLGWMGNSMQDVYLLRVLLLMHEDESVRITAATSHDPMRMNSEKYTDDLLRSLVRSSKEY